MSHDLIAGSWFACASFHQAANIPPTGTFTPNVNTLPADVPDTTPFYHVLTNRAQASG